MDHPAGGRVESRVETAASAGSIAGWLPDPFTLPGPCRRRLPESSRSCRRRRLLQFVRRGHHGQGPRSLQRWTPGKVVDAGKSLHARSRPDPPPPPLNAAPVRTILRRLPPPTYSWSTGWPGPSPESSKDARKLPTGLVFAMHDNSLIVHGKTLAGGCHDRYRAPTLRLPRALRVLCRGKDKAYFEVLARLARPPHAEGCACQPWQVKRACLRKVMTFMAKSSPALFELVETWALEDHDD